MTFKSEGVIVFDKEKPVFFLSYFLRDKLLR